MKKLCWGAFYFSTHLKEIYLPDSLTEIEDEAFYNYPNLVRVYMKKGTRFNKQSVFENCNKSLQIIYR